MQILTVDVVVTDELISRMDAVGISYFPRLGYSLTLSWEDYVKVRDYEPEFEVTDWDTFHDLLAERAYAVAYDGSTTDLKVNFNGTHYLVEADRLRNLVYGHGLEEVREYMAYTLDDALEHGIAVEVK